MCLMCQEELIKGLTLKEVRRAGTELVQTTTDMMEIMHVLETIAKIEESRKEWMGSDSNPEMPNGLYGDED